uniref:Bromo domain-containing protein n=1 Tax=Corethron hystrix TaxID=216773 RepID=A0A7S1BEB8_9STRA
MDLSQICRNMYHRKYKSLEKFRIDVWRIFSNCIKYHSKDGSPAYISIAKHLCEYFNALYSEYLVPSQAPTHAYLTQNLGYTEAKVEETLAIHQSRETERGVRLQAVASILLSDKVLRGAAAALDFLVSSGGSVDLIDRAPLEANCEAMKAIDELWKNLGSLRNRLEEEAAAMADAEGGRERSYTAGSLASDLRLCVDSLQEALSEGQEQVAAAVVQRLDRLFHKLVVPIYEVNSRGVRQSSIWGGMATVVWAREKASKPYWPALVLGLLIPMQQREAWHDAITERNETRLPEKIRSALQTTKKKAEAMLKRENSQSSSFFLVEFMGKHEFMWVREADVLEGFNPQEDPNAKSDSGRKKRPSRMAGSNSTSSPIFAAAVQEGAWALEEFDNQVKDPCGDCGNNDTDDVLFTYDQLCKQDSTKHDEDEVDSNRDKEEESLEGYPDDEAFELLHRNGFLDYSTAGKKIAKQRAQERKKKREDYKKEALRAKKEAEFARKQKRKAAMTNPSSKRTSERSKNTNSSRIKKTDRKHKTIHHKYSSAAIKIFVGPWDRHTATPSTKGGIFNKRDRAIAKVKAYLSKIACNELTRVESAEFPLAVGADAGLLGMCLAFLGSANIVVPPKDCAKILNPMEDPQADASHPLSSRREAQLQAKAAALEKELSSLRALREEQRDLLRQATSRREKSQLRRIAEAKEQAIRKEEEQKEEEKAAAVRAEIAAKRKAQREALKARKERERKARLMQARMEEEEGVTVTVVSENYSPRSQDDDEEEHVHDGVVVIKHDMTDSGRKSMRENGRRGHDNDVTVQLYNTDSMLHSDDTDDGEDD